MSVRTYCVIPHSAREDTDFFHGVFEDGLRVLYQGRLHSLFFSHVLSPAHDYAKHINGPLLAALRGGGSATLILATPNSEVANTISPPVKADDMAEVTLTVMDLYAQLFPLLFRSVEDCAVVNVSVVTVSATERVLLDNLQEDRRLRSTAEAHHHTLHRQNSATGWGTLLRLLEDRHVAMESSATALEGQTACVVTVELAGHGRLVLVDTASSQELLQQLTLILGMEAEGEGARTYPLHTPLRELLTRNTPPHAVVQVVCLPAPQETQRQTMRVLHFGSTIEAWRSRRSRSSSISGTAMRGSDGDMNNNKKHSSGGDAPKQLKSSTEGGEVGTNVKLFTRPAAASPSVSFEVDSAVQRHTDHVGLSASDRHDNLIDHRGALGRGDGDVDEERSVHIASQPQRYVPSVDNSVTVLDRSAARGATPTHLPPSAVDRAAAAVRQRGREDQLGRQVASLQAQLAEMARDEVALRKSRDDAVKEKETAELSLRSKESMWADLQRSHNRAKQENADYAKLVQKLLQQVRVLEKDTKRQKQQDVTVVRELRLVKEQKAELSAQLTRLRKEVMGFRRESTYRAREATLSRIVPTAITVPPLGKPTPSRSAVSSRSSSILAGRERAEKSALSGAASQRRGDGGDGGRTSPRARRLYDSSVNDGNATSDEGSRDVEGRHRYVVGGASAGGLPPPPSSLNPEKSAALYGLPTAQSRRVTDITVEELRWRNRHLEEEVARLQERLLRALGTTNTTTTATGKESFLATPGPSGSCATCAVMRERAGYLSAELANVREEKDRLLALVQSSEVGRGTAAAKALRGVPDKEETALQTSTVEGDGEEEDKEGSSRRDDIKRHTSAALRGTAATRDVVSALLSGCASLQSQLECAQSVLQRRLLHQTHTSSASAVHTDPLSHVSSRVLEEHREAVAALAESLRRIADKPATAAASYAPPHPSSSGISAASLSPVQQQQQVRLPPVPRCATAGNVETLTGHLAFEGERCRHLRAFLPTFAQLAVATEHLLMRLEATEPEA